MVSDPNSQVSPYELFQELLTINNECAQLRRRLGELQQLRQAVDVQLIDKCMGPAPEIDDVGVVKLNDQLYLYTLDLEDGTVKDFYPVSEINQGS